MFEGGGCGLLCWYIGEGAREADESVWGCPICEWPNYDCIWERAQNYGGCIKEKRVIGMRGLLCIWGHEKPYLTCSHSKEGSIWATVGISGILY